MANGSDVFSAVRSDAIGPSRTWRDVRPDSEMRRITDIAERLLAVSINEYAPWRPPDFAGAEANSRDFHETFFTLAVDVNLMKGAQREAAPA
jgi:hypothetical protein